MDAPGARSTSVSRLSSMMAAAWSELEVCQCDGSEKSSLKITFVTPGNSTGVAVGGRLGAGAEVPVGGNQTIVAVSVGGAVSTGGGVGTTVCIPDGWQADIAKASKGKRVHPEVNCLVI